MTCPTSCIVPNAPVQTTQPQSHSTLELPITLTTVTSRMFFPVSSPVRRERSSYERTTTGTKKEGPKAESSVTGSEFLF